MCACMCVCIKCWCEDKRSNEAQCSASNYLWCYKARPCLASRSRRSTARNCVNKSAETKIQEDAILQFLVLQALFHLTPVSEYDKYQDMYDIYKDTTRYAQKSYIDCTVHGHDQKKGDTPHGTIIWWACYSSNASVATPWQRYEFAHTTALYWWLMVFYSKFHVSTTIKMSSRNGLWLAKSSKKGCLDRLLYMDQIVSVAISLFCYISSP